MTAQEAFMAHIEGRVDALEEEVRQLREGMPSILHPLVAGFNRFRSQATAREEAKREQGE